MSDKLKILLDKIGLDEDYYSSFENGKIEKILIDKKNKVWNIILNLEKTIDIDVLKKMEKLLKANFKDLDDVYVTFKYNNVDSSKIEEYFKYILTKVRLYNMFGNHKIDITKDVLNINVINQMEYRKIEKGKKNIESLYERYGFDIKLKITVDDMERNAIKQEIEKDTFVKV